MKHEDEHIITDKNSVYVLQFIAARYNAAIFLYYYGLKKISASVAAICELAFPLTAVLLEYFIRGNILGPIQWVGVAILLFSILKVSGIGSDNLQKKVSAK